MPLRVNVLRNAKLMDVPSAILLTLNVRNAILVMLSKHQIILVQSASKAVQVNVILTTSIFAKIALKVSIYQIMNAKDVQLVAKHVMEFNVVLLA